MSGFLQVLEMISRADSPAETQRALAIAEKLPLSDAERGMIARELIAATARCKRCG
jgi:hypothetical protein